MKKVKALLTSMALFLCLITLNGNASGYDEYFTCVKIAEALYGKNSNGNSIPNKSENKQSIRCSIQAIRKIEEKHYLTYMQAIFNLKDGSYKVEDSKEDIITNEGLPNRDFNHWATDKIKNQESWDKNLAKIKIPPIKKHKVTINNIVNEKLKLCKVVGDKEDKKTANRLMKINEAKAVGNMIYCLYKFDKSGFLKYAEAEIFPNDGTYNFRWLR